MSQNTILKSENDKLKHERDEMNTYTKNITHKIEEPSGDISIKVNEGKHHSNNSDSTSLFQKPEIKNSAIINKNIIKKSNFSKVAEPSNNPNIKVSTLNDMKSNTYQEENFLTPISQRSSNNSVVTSKTKQAKINRMGTSRIKPTSIVYQNIIQK